jgi:hypothetical protein
VTIHYNEPIGVRKTEDVKVVFETTNNRYFYLLEEESWIEYQNGDSKDLVTHMDLEEKYREKLGKGETLRVQNLEDATDSREITRDDVNGIFVTSHTNI